MDETEASLKKRIRLYEQWKATEELAAEPVAAAVVSDPDVTADPDTVDDRYPELYRVGVARKLAEKSHALITRDPARSLIIATLATNVATKLVPPEEFDFAVFDAEGVAWMRKAAALAELGRFQDAATAATCANWFFYLAAPFALRSTATLALIEGQIQHALGHTDIGLRLIKRGADMILRIFAEPDKYVEAMTVYGGILMRAGRYDEAAQTWEDIGALARMEGDTATLAYIVNNVGLCHLNLRQIEQAKECFSAAVRMFENLGFVTEVPRVRGSFALALAQEGRYGHAILEYRNVRATFQRFGMMWDACDAALRVVEVSIIAGKATREIRRLCEETITFFNEAGLPHEARRAAAYLDEIARHHQLAVEDVQRVGIFLKNLRTNPTDVFSPERSLGSN